MHKSYLAISCVFFVVLLSGCGTLHKAEHEQIVTVSKPIKSVPITVSYQGGVFYRVQVNNTLPTAITLAWDESVYVTTAGESVRILHLRNKYNLPERAPAQQASSPIAPNSQFQADFIGDDWLDCARRSCTPQPKDGFKNARIYLAFNIKGKRVTWQGEVAFVPPKQP
ncbi:hypothetical protein GALLN_00002 [Gallionellaceae bacterium]|nr:hypothetical protein GALLN_00002 [Gallionellaceae bacterium]